MTEVEKLREILKEANLSYNEILEQMQWSQKYKKKNKKLLYDWEEQGHIIKLKNGKYTIPENEGFVRGNISIGKNRFGFVDSEEESIFIHKTNLNRAIDNDVVLVKVLKEGSEGKKKEGEVYKIISRERDTIIGIYQNSNNFGFVVPNEYIGNDIYISKSKKQNAKTGDLVAVKVYFWGDDEKKPEGEIISVLGDGDDPNSIIESLILTAGLNEEFPKEVEKELDKLSEITKEEISSRRDLRHLNIITIDGSDAKDLDDAVYVEKREDHYYLSVSIADVSYYVKPYTELDKEAQKRGNSVYLVDRVIPMLPRKLSNGLCSLNPNEDKLAFTVDMKFDFNGKIIENDFYRSVITSKYRMTYSDVNKIFLDDSDLKEKYKEIDNMLSHMLELSKIIRETKKRRGSIDFELPEIKVKLNEDKSVKDIELRNRGDAEKLIEDFMVAANEVVAEKLHWEETPAIYRIHEDPDEEKMRELNETLSRFGYFIPNISDMHPGKFQKIIEKSSETPEGFLVHKLILKAMQRARYENKNLGHFGLASQFYLHFTSPIRRYSDLIVHRVLAISLERYVDPKEKKEWIDVFKDISRHISKTERDADKLETETVKVKLCEYMSDKVGETFIGRISGMTKNKIFLNLENHVEVVYDIYSEKDDYEYDEENFQMINVKFNKSYTIGDTIKILISSVSYEKLEINCIPFER